jgi:hypothetical protein
VILIPPLSAIRTAGATNANITRRITVTAQPIRDVDEKSKVPAKSNFSKK